MRQLDSAWNREIFTQNMFKVRILGERVTLGINEKPLHAGQGNIKCACTLHIAGSA